MNGIKVTEKVTYDIETHFFIKGEVVKSSDFITQKCLLNLDTDLLVSRLKRINQINTAVLDGLIEELTLVNDFMKSAEIADKLEGA